MSGTEPRLEPLRPDQLDDAQRRLYDAVLASPRGQGGARKMVLRADETDFGIPEAVTDAVKKYLFKPGTKNGVKIKTHATVTKRYSFR